MEESQTVKSVGDPLGTKLLTFVLSVIAGSVDVIGLPGSVGFAINICTHKPPSHRAFVQALGTTPTLTSHVEIMHG